MQQHKVNFLKRNRHFHESPVRRRTRVFATGLGIGVLVLVVLTFPFAYAAGRIAYGASAGRTALMAAQDDAEKLDFDGARAQADIAHDAFLGASEQVSVLKFFSFIPGTADSVAGLDALLSSGVAASAAASDIFAIGKDVVAAVGSSSSAPAVSGAPLALPDLKTRFKDLSGDDKRRMLAAFAGSAPRLKEASMQVTAALAAFDRIPQSELNGPFGEVLKPLRARLALAQQAVSVAAPVSGVMASLLGYPDQKRYLFFLQNDTELRPSGGFIGVVGAMTVQDASITAMRTDDSYALDGPSEKLPRPVPPAPIVKYLGVKKWYLRDANWSPDFAVSADTMQRFYREESQAVNGGADAPVDGVAAVDTYFARDILRMTGPVTASGTTFNADNLVDELQFAVEKGFVREGIPFDARKDIVGELAAQVVQRLTSMPLSRLLDALQMVDRNFKEGHIALYSTDSTLRAEIDSRGWGGRLVPVRGDYLLWVDANMAALKTDGVMKRTVAYSVVPAAGGTGYEAHVTMTYKNAGTFTWKTSRYRTYARVYAPLGSRLLGVDGAMENDKIKDPRRRIGTPDEYDELGRHVMAAFVAVEPGETRTLTFRYAVAPSVAAQIAAGTYHLDVEKQPGTLAHGLTLDIDIGKKLKDALPAEPRAEWGDARYRLTSDLKTDRAFDLKF
ncbi:MAG: hypothetical protein RLZZ324_364 [Candidatus Parcubacteria bacterium]|jgi:hypothetical protein